MHRTTARVLDSILLQPGRTRSELARDLSTSWTLVDFHVRKLVNEGTVWVLQTLREAFVFPRSVPRKQAIIMLVMRDSQAMTVLHDLASRPGIPLSRRSADLSVRVSLVERVSLLVRMLPAADGARAALT